ncbi:MAG: zinc ABC transporter substrate-binding protein, partial [Propionibacteriaceae bacterium]|nr:zinc ABC transporter substrate-binding protein [Propionibacteriaceae bacterium]
VQKIARENGVTTIFFETLVSPAVSESIAGDLGLKTDVLDPLEGITADSKGTNYLEVMQANGTSLKAANQCS